MRSLRSLLWAFLVILVVPFVAVAPARVRSTPAEKCAAAKRKLTGRKIAALIACDAKAVAKGTTVASRCETTAKTAFMTGWGNAEAKGGCATTNDETTIENKVDAHQTDLETTLEVTGATPSKCTAAKFKAAGKKGACKLGCAAKAALKGLPLSDATVMACLSTCTTKFSAAFTKAETNGDCRTTGDAGTVESKIDAFVVDATNELPSTPCPTGRTFCAGRCVDISTDPSNCGSCDFSCQAVAGAVCIAGACGCPQGESLCGRFCFERPGCYCANLQNDHNNCGTCGTVCPASAPFCTSGTCTCPSGDTICGSACVDTSSDRNNCGGCGNTCAADCCGSSCTDTFSDPRNCGACGEVCPSPQLCDEGRCSCEGLELCGTSCVDTADDVNNCGSCGHVCPSAQLCRSGVCMCPGERELCGSSCVDTSMDDRNCGSCGHVCPTAGFCINGSCICGGNTLCGSACVNTSSDPNNCGGCGNVCPVPEICSSGVCTCGASLTLCGSACVDISRDPANCGMCARACPTGQVCDGGSCCTDPCTTSRVCGSATNSCGKQVSCGTCPTNRPKCCFSSCVCSTCSCP